MLSAMAVMTAISAVFLVLRLFCKARHGKLFGWDDYIVTFSWVSPSPRVFHQDRKLKETQLCMVAFLACTIVSTEHGFGQHFYDLLLLEAKIGLKWLYIGSIFAHAAIVTSKVAFAVTLLRLSTEPWHARFLWSVILMLSLSMGSCLVLEFAQCSPVEKLWDFTAPGRCWDPHTQIYYSIFANCTLAACQPR